MLFNSFEFILVFLPLTLLGYFLIARLSKQPIYSLGFLALASLAFYAYWDPRFLPIILSSVTLNYFFGLLLGRHSLTEKLRKLIFAGAIIANLSALVFYKYVNFGLNIWNKITGHSLESLAIILPLGVSFFTFTQIAYLADIFSGHSREKNFIKYLLFVTYFPHLIAGPILHHKEMMPQFSAQASRRISGEKIALGLTVFAIGLFKKAIIADSFSQIANPIFDSIGHTVVVASEAWSAALAYALQIYFDFSGYSDMAVGLSMMFGIMLPFNFDAPYKSKSIIEFWRRWHITLSRFLRDYVYIAFGGNQCSKARRYFNLLLTMVLGGLWHGAGWTYIVWGYLHGLYLTINHAWRKILQRQPLLKRFSTTVFYALASLLLTQLAVVVAWVYFRAASLRHAHRMLGMMFHLGKFKDSVTLSPGSVINIHLLVIALAYLSCFILPNITAIFDKWELAIKTYNNTQTWSLFSIKWKMSATWAVLTALLLISAFFMILIVGEGSQFLYFQF